MAKTHVLEWPLSGLKNHTIDFVVGPNSSSSKEMQFKVLTTTEFHK
jgi:hypothetical protein